MKVVIIICDNLKQYKDYMDTHVIMLANIIASDISCSMGIFTVDDTKFIPLYHKEDIRKMMGFNRENIEIRIIGEKAMIAYTCLRGQPDAFGLWSS